MATRRSHEDSKVSPTCRQLNKEIGYPKLAMEPCRRNLGANQKSTIRCCRQIRLSSIFVLEVCKSHACRLTELGICATMHHAGLEKRKILGFSVSFITAYVGN